MLGVTGLLMEMSKELSRDAGRTESVCPGHRAAGNPGAMETVKSVCCCLADRRPVALQSNSAAAGGENLGTVFYESTLPVCLVS